MLANMIKTVGVVALAVALIGTGYWGYQEHQDKNSVLIKAENNYQRAFHDLNNNMSNLEDELGKSIAMNSRNLLAPCLANIWRVSYVAQSNVGQLPLTLTPFHKTEKFLAQISNYTYDIGMRDLENEPLTDEEWEKLQTLHSQSKEINAELRKLQAQVLNQNLRWMDVEMMVASENKNMGKTIMDGIDSLDRKVEGYVEVEQDSLSNKSGQLFGDMKGEIEGREISAEEAKQKVKEFLNDHQDGEMDVTENDRANGIPIYTVRAKRPGSNHHVAADISKQGGHLLWMLDSRDIEQTEMGLNEAENRAVEFLENHELESMEAVQSDQYDNVGVFDFVYVEDHVRVFPDLIRVKVALDNGDIIGYEAIDYLVNHDEEREIPEATLSIDEAKEAVNPNFEVLEEHVSIIEIKENEEILCYELLGTVGDETYRIFVNADSGEEEKVEKMKQAEPIV